MSRKAQMLLNVVEKLLVELAVELEQDFECVDVKLKVDLACPIGEGLHSLT